MEEETEAPGQSATHLQSGCKMSMGDVATTTNQELLEAFVAAGEW